MVRYFKEYSVRSIDDQIREISEEAVNSKTNEKCVYKPNLRYNYDCFISSQDSYRRGIRARFNKIASIIVYGLLGDNDDGLDINLDVIFSNDKLKLLRSFDKEKLEVLNLYLLNESRGTYVEINELARDYIVIKVCYDNKNFKLAFESLLAYATAEEFEEYCKKYKDCINKYNSLVDNKEV